MPTHVNRSARRTPSQGGTARKAAVSKSSVKTEADAAVAALKREASKQFRSDMESRYGIVTDKAFGVPMSRIKSLAKQLSKQIGKNAHAPAHKHALAEALWETGWYEARTLAAFIEDPALVTPAQMDRWRRDFDNWAICDTVCFHLFDRTEHAYGKVRKWARLRDDFGRRAAFALLASLALHDKDAPDGRFSELLPVIEQGASDDRNFVKKAVSWALRAVGSRGPKLKIAARRLARRLADSQEPAERWVGKDALRKLK